MFIYIVIIFDHFRLAWVCVVQQFFILMLLIVILLMLSSFQSRSFMLLYVYFIFFPLRILIWSVYILCCKCGEVEGTKLQQESLLKAFRQFMVHYTYAIMLQNMNFIFNKRWLWYNMVSNLVGIVRVKLAINNYDQTFQYFFGRYGHVICHFYTKMRILFFNLRDCLRISVWLKVFQDNERTVLEVIHYTR